MDMRKAVMLILVIGFGWSGSAPGQEYGSPDRGQPGDAMIQAYLARLADALHDQFLKDVEDADDWTRRRSEYEKEYLYMMGLDPLPERTPPSATVTGMVAGDGFVVENLHYQSQPGLYVTANLYRPPHIPADERLPAVLYVCGHSGMGRDGNKTAFQTHGIWFARHGYVCLVVDTLQLGEIAGVHHGTYREGRWWWHARGYTPAGVECWNGVRGIDYLVSRPDVDPERIAVTGISGGGAATYWIAAADDRGRVAVPVSGMADLPSYVNNRVINGHCDCMFLYNTFEWPWTRIAGLLAPRPQLFVNSDQDPIFPMDANERVINRLERLYSLFGAGDRVDAVVSIGGHAYREDIRQAAYRFINTYLKDDPRIVTDSEVDAVAESGPDRQYPIDPQRLRVFPTDADLPSNAINATIDQHFVPMAQVELPEPGAFEDWKERLLAELRRVTFRPMPERIPPARPVGDVENGTLQVETEEGIVVPLQEVSGRQSGRILLVIAGADEGDPIEDHRADIQNDGDGVFRLQPRGVGPTRWTTNDPPNYVERSHVLLGRTVDAGRVWDVAAAARLLSSEHGPDAPIVVVSAGASGLVGAYAALLEPDIAEVVLIDPPASHMDPEAPPLLNVLRVLDVPEALGLLAPRPLTLLGTVDEALRERVATIHQRAGAADQKP